MGKLTVEERFWAKVDKSGECWIWTASIATTGYGKFGVRHGVWEGAHRVAYRLTIGPIPDGLYIDHLCRNRACVNPAHLEPVTNAENLRRGGAAITHCPQGHEYNEINAWRTPTGHRQCRVCNRERKRVAKGYQFAYGGTHCRHGHEYTPENTRTNGAGRRVCRACARDATRRHRAAS